MKPKGILMKAEMVRATMRPVNPKKQTRRLQGLEFVNSNPDEWEMVREEEGGFHFVNLVTGRTTFEKPLYPPGQILYVKETWRTRREWDSLAPNQLPCKDEFYDLYIDYAAGLNEGDTRLHGKTRVSIHMPKWAARIWLEVTDVRVQRLQDISEEDAIAEGVEEIHVEHAPSPYNDFSGDFSFAFKDYLNLGEFAGWGGDAGHCYTAKESYHTLWESINGPGSWDRNDWVFAYTFKRVERPDHIGDANKMIQPSSNP